MEFDHLHDYATFLDVITNHICPPLVEDLLKFYRRVLERRKPGLRPYYAEDLRDLARDLDQLQKDNDIEQARRWFLSLSKGHAIAVMDAIQSRTEQAQSQPRLLPGHPSTAIETIRFALLILADKLQKNSDTSGQPDSKR